jgi:hypothetical protein
VKLLNLVMTFCIGLGSPRAMLGRSGAPDKTCGLTEYCARTDRRVDSYSKTPTPIGPAGSIIIDPSFGSRILRVTDSKSDPNGQGRSMMTPSSSEQNSWNSTTTRFYVLTPGGQRVLYDFDPSSLKAHVQGVLRVPWEGEPQFSYTQPDILYGISSRDPAFEEYNISNGKLTSLHSISECLKVDTRGHSVTVSADDSRMSTSLGPRQDDNYVVYVYDRKRGCRWYNTRTGEIGGKWGPTGIISVPDRAFIHNTRMSKSGKFVWIGRSGHDSIGKGWLVWEVDSLNVSPCPSQCSGHHAMGYNHIIGPSGQRHPFELLVRPLNHLDAPSNLVPGLEPSRGFWYDSHFSWSNVNADDTNPFCLSTYRPSNPNSPGMPLDVTGPWENEIDCVEVDGKGSKVWRFAHTYSTAKNGFWSTPRGNVSQDGRFFIFTSDWQDQLGQTPNGKSYRTDVFIVELR